MRWQAMAIIRRSGGRVAAAVLLSMAAWAVPASAADWPAYRGDAERTGRSTETLAFPLAPAWKRVATQPPAPAWPEPGRQLHPMDFDYAPQPVVAGGLVYFGSTSDDTLRAVDAATGAVAWSYTAGAPIRFAPHVTGGKCYFAADDGYAVCLDARTGAVIWRQRLGMDDRRLVANGRLASRWPCRSGVLVSGDRVYVTAGMWPSEGVYVYALDAATGREVWCNDTACYDYLAYPHAPSAAFGGPAPQGYLLLSQGLLLVPTGRCAPAAFDAATGKLVHWTADPGNRGGTWVTAHAGTMFVSTVAWQPDQTFRMGESQPHRADSLAAFEIKTGKEAWPYSKAIRALTNDDPKAARWRSEISQGLFSRQRVVFAGDRCYASGFGVVDAFDLSGKDAAARAWSFSYPRTYAELLCGNALILGGQDEVVAIAVADGKPIWRGPVDGQARGLAVSDGRLIVTTDRGTVHAFSPGQPAAVQPSAVVQSPAAAQPVAGPAKPAASAVDAAAAAILASLPENSAARSNGFAVVVGTSDAALAAAIAGRTALHVACVLPDEKTAAAERARLVATTSLYGSRLSIHVPAEIDGARTLPFVPYLANLVVAAGDAAGVGGAELYRVTRPCGGALVLMHGAEKLAVATKAPPAEARALPGGVQIVRGKLPGAFDWDSPTDADERVRWPLEFQWYGEPGPQLLLARHRRPRTPIAANGRLFVFGETHLTAVDSYNGATLWRRRLNSGICGGEEGVVADDSAVYISGKGGVLKIDAATGRLMQVYAAGAGPSVPVHNASQPLRIDADARRVDATGAISFNTTPDALQIILDTRNATASRNDCWELAFDFRKPADRLSAPGAGTFELIVNAHAGTLRAHKTFAHVPVKLERKPAAAGESQVVLSIAWVDLQKQLGYKPDSFAMSADLKLWTEDFRERLWARPLAGKAGAFDESQAIIALTSEAAAAARPSASVPADQRVLSPLLPVPIVPESALPPVARGATKLPPLTKGRVDPGDGDYSDLKLAQRAQAAQAAEDPAIPTETGAPRDLFLKRLKGFELASRVQPLTGDKVVRDYTRSYGCSGTSSSAVMDFFRSGTIGMYDRLDDSGMRNISGIRSGCGLSLVPAHGLLLYSESASDCSCAYSFNTSLAMAPATGRRNEDWALFDDVDLTSGIVRKAAINLGAAGDRRADDSTLWLAYPRPAVGIARGTTMQLPYTLETFPGGGAFRTNADRRPAANTDKPWVAGSQIVGISRLNVDLVYHEPRKLVLSPGVQPPTVDGQLNDACWDGFAPLPAAKKDGAYYIRHDANHVYVAYEQKPELLTSGKAEPWKDKARGVDARYENDDHARVAFRNAGGQRVVAFALAAGGGTYDGLLDLATDIPRAAGNITVDGADGDWPAPAATVALPGNATLRLAWTPKGLAMLAELPAGYQAGAPGLTGLTLVLTRPDAPTHQLSFDTRTDFVRADAWQGEKSAKPAIEFRRSARAGGVTAIEAVLPWAALGGEAALGQTVGLYARAYDPSESYFKPETPVPWATARSRGELTRPDRRIALRLAEAGRAGKLATEARKSHVGYSVVDVIAVAREDAGWNGTWTGKTTLTNDRFRAELAIPWTTLEAAGLKRENLLADVTNSARFTGGQDNVVRQLDRAAVQVQTLPPSAEGARYTVRLTFAELQQAAPGQRVFDVLLQGKPVLKDFDVAREAGGALRAITREFPVTANRQIELRFVPKGGANPSPEAAPILNAIEVIRQD